MAAKEVRIGSRKITLSTVRGEVTDEKKWATATTRVYGGGSTSVSSYTTNVEHDQFRLREPDGSVCSIRLENAKLQVARGDDLTVIVGTRVRDGHTAVVAVHNHTTGVSQVVETGLNVMLPEWLDNIIDPIMVVVLSIVVGLLGVAGVIGGVYAFMYSDMPARGGAILLLGGLAITWLGWRGMTARGYRVTRLRRTVSSMLATLQ
jgi:hypothetical protein